MTPPRRPAPQPVESDAVPVIAVGTALWALALVVLLLLHGRLEDAGHADWVWVALAGTGLGLLGLWHVRRRRDALARSAIDASADEAGPNTG